MKKLIYSLLSVTFALFVSSFSVRRATNVYFLIYSGPHNARSSYQELNTPLINPVGTTNLIWMRITDGDGVVTAAEFNNMFETLDVVNDATNSLHDDVEKVVTSGVYQYELAKSN